MRHSDPANSCPTLPPTPSPALLNRYTAALVLVRWRCVAGGDRVIALATFRDYGLGWDDYTHSQYGDLLIELY